MRSVSELARGGQAHSLGWRAASTGGHKAVTLSPVVRARLRLVIIATGLIPLALLARLVASGRLTEVVQRLGANAWKQYDAVRDAAAD